MSGRGRGRGKRIVDTKDEKKTKKKQFPVVALVTPNGIEGNLLPNGRQPLIVHLPLQSKNIIMNDMPITYDPHPPIEAQPYDIYADNPFCNDMEPILLKNSQEIPESIDENKSVTTISTSNPEIDYYTLKSTLLIQYQDSSDIKKLPEYSSAACFWCSHTFTHRPVILPIRDTGEYLVVTGNFCCPECAAAYLFDMHQDYHTRWEQYALLHRVYGDSCNGKIHLAPSYTILKHFGGLLTIDEYRQLIQSYKVRVDIHLPPMVSILATMDTKPIDFYDSGLTKNINETVKERLEKAEEVLRLRRVKPLKAWESTLDACINLKITHHTT